MATRSMSSWEERCLSQLDDVSIWESLKREIPNREEDLPRSVSQLIFRFNFMIFSIAIGVVMVGAAFASGSTLADVVAFPDVLFGAGFVILAALSFSLYTTGIYKRSWNRRALSLRNEVSD